MRRALRVVAVVVVVVSDRGRAGSKRVGASPLRRPASDGDQLSEMREYREARRFEAAAKASPDYFRVSGPLASPGTSTSMVDEEED